MPLLGGPLLKIARLRAGLTQRGLAQLLALPQSSVARWESRARQPTIDNLIEAVRACGLDITVSLHAMDRSNDAFIWELLDEAPAERLRRQVAAANGLRPVGREAAAQRAGRGPSKVRNFEPLTIIRALAARGVRSVLVGRLAEILRGSPLVPTDAEVAVCLDPSARNRTAFEQALRDLAATRWEASDEHPDETPFPLRPFQRGERWWIESAGGALAVMVAPPGTQGFSDLIRQATRESLDTQVRCDVSSLLDLIRIADAAIDPADRGGLPTLRRALELSEDYLPPEERPLVVPEGLEELFAAHGLTPS